ncbi:MAG: hypothetical protein HFE77_00895 [Clostridiales bacterium]|nr:hypothetical protein [Clostridiales bacterium]
MDRQTITMIAEVIEAYPDGLMVMDKQSGQTIQVHAKDIECFSQGEWICILYNGQMTHSIPPQITAISIESLHDAPPMPVSTPLSNDPRAQTTSAPIQNNEIYVNSTDRWDAVNPMGLERSTAQPNMVNNPSGANNRTAPDTTPTYPTSIAEVTPPRPNPDLTFVPNETFDGPPFEMRGIIVQKGPDFFIIRNRQYNFVRINYEYAHHFCVRQRVIVKYYISTLSQPPQIPAVDVIPICGA